ncbi:prohead protease protein [Rhizobium phage RHph_X2_25]|nr:prohead protease protein [Rhizobium phage RHph_X2_25]
MTIDVDRGLVRYEIKFAADEIDSETGIFSGYGAIFGNLDSHRDIIEPGAFKASLTEWSGRSRLPAMKLMHGSSGNPFMFDDLPIGRWLEMREDAKGLFVKGKLSNLDTDYGRRIHGLMKDGVLDGLSIGYRAVDVLPPAPGGKERRRLKSVNLFEVSVVDDPSNGRARVRAVKSSFNPREIEDSLRDAGLSRADSVKAVAVLKSILLRDEAEPETNPRDEDKSAELRSLAERIRALAA